MDTEGRCTIAALDLRRWRSQALAWKLLIVKNSDEPGRYF